MENQIEELRKELCLEIEVEREMSSETKIFIKAGINIMAKRLGNLKIENIEKKCSI
ncbi:MAG: hypothetical protein IPM51_12065 [Sphingobacteriaceae bacterium]|nr:hypothetical protein [Sphingobacteriaceae bacterium]